MTTAASASRPKRSRIKIITSAGRTSPEAEPPTSTRRTKRRKVVRETEDDSWELDPLGGTQGNNDTVPRDTHDEGIPEDADYTAVQPEMDINEQTPTLEIEPIDVEVAEVPMTTPKPPAKGKRGRKKKGSKPAEPAPELNEPTPAEPEPEPAAAPVEALVPEPPAKRRRGRPRRSEAAKLQAEPEDEQLPEQQLTEEAQAETLSELNHNSQPGAAADPEGNDIGDANPDSKENSPPAAKGITDTETDTKGREKDKQAAAGKDVKAGTGGAQTVRYRVGLSKRSRIAPLLKCLKKPV
jgi:hypothetical protein